MKYLLLFLFFLNTCFSQEIKISGIIKDSQNNALTSVSVVVLDQTEKILAYTYSKENGKYNLIFNKSNNTIVVLSISCLGYSNKKIEIDLSNKATIIQDIELDNKIEFLKEVVVEVNQKIKIDNDTTSIKIASYGNNTEQTVEDILKKLPGIEVQKDGSIKAHGKYIDKILIEGEDLLDHNYKLLSKNLDVKVLDVVQIIDHFEENPILKKMNSSEKVALNLKLKKDKKNILFGNVTAGVGVFSENRWKEGINLGLLKKRIKLFYLADYNNSGEKATDQVTKENNENNIFGEDRFEKKAKTIYAINSNENGSFSKSQSVFNDALFNSLSFTTKIKPNMTLRGVGYFTNDNQFQYSNSQTKYNIENNPVSFTESNNYNGKKTLSSGEMELKYTDNKKNFITNLLIYKNNPSNTSDQLFYNDTLIDQSSKIKNQTFYNHFNHTLAISRNIIFHNYAYFGSDKINENTTIISPFLNAFLKTNPNAINNQKADNSMLFYGLKSKLIGKYEKLMYTIGMQLENKQEKMKTNFLVDNTVRSDYENLTKLNQFSITFQNGLQYNFTEKIKCTANLNYTKNHFETFLNDNNIEIINPKFIIEFYNNSFGNFTLAFENNNNTPEINYLTSKFQLTNYKTFIKGTVYEGLSKNENISFSYHLFKDEKHFSITNDFHYSKYKKLYTSAYGITDNFNFNKHIYTDGGKNYTDNFSLINFIKKLHLVTKIGTTQNWSNNPTKTNSDDFVSLNSYSGTYTLSATSYFKIPINFDFGFNYNHFKTDYDGIKDYTKTSDEYINCNYTISKTWLAEINTNLYQINGKNYSFINAVVNYNPEKSRYSYRLVLNNLSNEKEFSIVTLDRFTSYRSSIPLVTRYLLLTAKYRF
jgi:hypothetical protein